MTESEIDRQKADALYRYHTTAVRLNHTKQRVRDIAAALHEAAVSLEQEFDYEQNGAVVRSVQPRPIESAADYTYGAVNVSVVIDAVRDMHDARSAANVAHDAARSLGVDPKAIEQLASENEQRLRDKEATRYSATWSRLGFVVRDSTGSPMSEDVFVRNVMKPFARRISG